MAFTLTKPGGWAFGELLTSVQMEDIDAKTADAIDGVGGGTYSPSSAINVGGKGLNVTGPFTASSMSVSAFQCTTFLATGAAVFSSNVQVVGTSSLIGNVSCTGSVTAADLIATDDLTVGDDASIGGDLAVSGNATVTGDLTVSDDAHVAGDLSVSGNTTIGSSSSDELDINALVVGQIRFSGNGRVALRTMTLPDADTTISIADGNFFFIPVDLSTQRNYPLSTTDAVDGDVMEFVSAEYTTALDANARVNSNNGSQDFTWNVGDARIYGKWVFDSGEWKLVAESHTG
ncbi:MAG TPA: hypothetical protein VGK73_10765 [Polyangiaceae bacterium]